MSRVSVSQRTKTQNNPLVLGIFSSLALRYLTGTLGPKNELIGYADTAFTSNGGFGGGAYNHWFQINISAPAWIIIAKGGPRPNYIQTSFYDLNFNPIQGRGVFEEDSVTQDGIYFPYLDHAMAAGSDLYNHYSRVRLDRGDDMYYPLGAGSYLLCVSTTRNELLQYSVGVIVEFPLTEGFIELEDGTGGCFLTETEIDVNRTVEVPTVITANTTISSDPEKPNGFTEALCTVNNGVTVTILDDSTWLIGFEIPTSQVAGYKFLLEPGNEEYWDTIHDHSLSEWQGAWNSTHQDTDKFPELFVPLTNRP